MIAVEILIRETSHNQLALAHDARSEGCSELECHAAMIVKKHVETAFKQLTDSAGSSLDVEGDPALKWKQKLFP